MNIDRLRFFDETRDRLFGGGFTQSQVDGLNELLTIESEFDDSRHIAYAIATTYWETARTMRPIREYGNALYFAKYERGKLGKMLGNVHPGDGARFCGRGFVQLTGRRNYEDWSARLGIDLVGNPDLAMQLDIARRILCDGMKLGTFTGKKLSDYFNGKDDAINARRIINGTDHAADIASIYHQFHDAIYPEV